MNINSELNSDLANYLDTDGLCSGNNDISRVSECTLGLQCGSMSLAPSYADVASAELGNSLPPSAPPLSQESTSGGVRGDDYGGGACSLSPSAPPLSQVSNSAQGVRSLGVEEVNVDSDGFMLVRGKKKKSNTAIVGAKKDLGGIGIRGAKRYADLYIGNCDLDVNADSLILYVMKETGIKIHKCELLESRSTLSRSFKLSLHMNDRYKLLSPDVWPEDIICRKFYSPRQKYQ